jgi:hypothetical protein
MDYEPVIKRALWDARELLWANAPPRDNLPDYDTLSSLTNIIESPAIRAALDRGGDTALAFYLRAMRSVLKNQSATSGETIGRLWPILDHPQLNELLGIRQNSRMILGPKKPPA